MCNHQEKEGAARAGEILRGGKRIFEKVAVSVIRDCCVHNPLKGEVS